MSIPAMVLFGLLGLVALSIALGSRKPLHPKPYEFRPPLSVWYGPGSSSSRTLTIDDSSSMQAQMDQLNAITLTCIASID